MMARTVKLLLLLVVLTGTLTLHASAADFATGNGIISRDGKALAKFELEFADTRQQTSQGLMFRPELKPGAGMLFDFKQARRVSMWMKNTLVPLDMLFVRADGTVRQIHTNAVPGSLDTIRSKVPVRYVLEILAGESERLGLRAGDTLTWSRDAN